MRSCPRKPPKAVKNLGQIECSISRLLGGSQARTGLQSVNHATPRFRVFSELTLAHDARVVQSSSRLEGEGLSV